MTEDEKQKVLIRIVDDDQAVREGGEFMLSCKGWKVKSYAQRAIFLSQTPRASRGAWSWISECPA